MDGDLSTISGRAKLWNLIEEYQPEHIWVAPECGPWSGWNRLNQSKSLDMFDDIQLKQTPTTASFTTLYKTLQISSHPRPTFSHGTTKRIRSFETRDHQTDLSDMPALPAFDMCRFGLRLPKTNKFLRKG